MEDETRYRLSILVGLAISGFFFWLGFAHWRIFAAFFVAVFLVGVMWFHYLRPIEWLSSKSWSRKERKQFRITMIALFGIIGIIYFTMLLLEPAWLR